MKRYEVLWQEKEGGEPQYKTFSSFGKAAHYYQYISGVYKGVQMYERHAYTTPNQIGEWLKQARVSQVEECIINATFLEKPPGPYSPNKAAVQKGLLHGGYYLNRVKEGALIMIQMHTISSRSVAIHPKQIESYFAHKDAKCLDCLKCVASIIATRTGVSYVICTKLDTLLKVAMAPLPSLTPPITCPVLAPVRFPSS